MYHPSLYDVCMHACKKIHSKVDDSKLQYTDRNNMMSWSVCSHDFQTKTLWVEFIFKLENLSVIIFCLNCAVFTDFQSNSMNPELSQLFSQSNCFCLKKKTINYLNINFKFSSNWSKTSWKFGFLVSEDNDFFWVRICQSLGKFEFYEMANLERIGCILSQIRTVHKRCRQLGGPLWPVWGIFVQN